MQNQLHVVRDAAVTSGGEGLAALRYAESISKAGCLVTLLSKYEVDLSIGDHEAAHNFELQVAPLHRSLFREVWLQYCFVRDLCRQKKFDLIHLHGMWSPFLTAAAMAAIFNKIPIVISPHGCLTPWALSYKHRKKWLALKLYQGMVLRAASLFVATAHQELNDIRQLGLRQDIAVIPNGVDAGLPVEKPVTVGQPRAVRTILFLSRVHPKKGLLDLVNAWDEVRRNGWRIIIAGGDEENYQATVEALIRSKGLESDFEFAGFVTGAQKQALFDIADLFILPTYSENFGLVVAEALANEIPVITTHGAPWQDLEQYRCGWWVVPGVAGIAAGLSEAMNLDQAEMRQMGRRGRQMIAEKYSWDNIGVAALGVSNWMLDRSLPKPAAVNSPQ
jgi:glycosyltransferase involved in cell wall biosynthesis